MKSSRVLVPVVAVIVVLCLSAMASAAVIDIQAAPYGKISGYELYQADVTSDTIGPHYFLFATYDISSILADHTVSIVSANLVYHRGYTNQGDTVPASFTVVQQVADYTLDTVSISSAFHKSLVGNDLDNPVVQGINSCTAAEVVTNLAYDGYPLTGGYGGLQSVNVTSIVNSWASGATNFGVGMSASIQVGPYDGLPYLEVTTAPAPEPMTLTLLGLGAMGLLRRRRA